MYNKEIAERYGCPITLDLKKYMHILQIQKYASPEFIERAKFLAEILLDYHHDQIERAQAWDEVFKNFDTCGIVRFDNAGVDLKTVLFAIREA